MDFKVLMTIIIIAIILLVFILFPEARALFMGIGKFFFTDLATTPEGAAALFENKIDEAQDSYNKADDFYKNTAGKLSIAKREYESIKSRITKIESECEALVKGNRMDLAALKAEAREELMGDMKRCTERISALQQATEQAKEARDICEKNLRDLKKKSKDVVENMRVKQELKQVYDGMDELKNITATDRLLDSVMEKNKSLDTMVEGSKASHDAKLSTRLGKAETEAKKLQSNDYLESLKKKYNK